MRSSIVWFRQDLRLQDNPAVAAAVGRGAPIVPLYCFDPAGEGNWAPGSASRAWLVESLRCLDGDLRKRGSRLVVRRGPSLEVLREIARGCGADALYFNRRYEPAAAAVEREVTRTLRGEGWIVFGGESSLLCPSGAIATHTGEPYRVFTPFLRAWLRTADASRSPDALQLPDPSRSPGVSLSPSGAPRRIPAPARWPRSIPPEEAGVRAGEASRGGRWVRDRGWKTGERGAQERLRQFIRVALAGYRSGRDDPSADLTSRLSPHLHFGEIGPVQVARAVEAEAMGNAVSGMVGAAESFVRQLAWREFAVHVLHHHPHSAERPLRRDFMDFPWVRGAALRRARLEDWKRGETGYPIVDAGMRQLISTGWMDNRVRMIAASFLTKDLRVPWIDGARWFWETLVDADLANNTFNWQWVAGCGADAAPYFRIFNPVLQGTKFDPDGAYVRRFVPELSRLPNRWIHRPAEASASVLDEAGVRIGRDYPTPIIDHAAAREEALRAFASWRKGGRPTPMR